MSYAIMVLKTTILKKKATLKGENNAQQYSHA